MYDKIEKGEVKMKSVWDKRPLNKLDLLKIVEEGQKKDPNRTKMDIFRELSQKYKRILLAFFLYFQ